MDKYEAMWKEFRESINADLKYHESGEMQSISESVIGKIKCEELLERMDDIEKKYNVE